MCTAYFVLRIPCCVGRGAYTQYAVRSTKHGRQPFREGQQ
jgi:hypothetical protein